MFVLFVSLDSVNGISNVPHSYLFQAKEAATEFACEMLVRAGEFHKVGEHYQDAEEPNVIYSNAPESLEEFQMNLTGSEYLHVVEVQDKRSESVGGNNE